MGQEGGVKKTGGSQAGWVQTLTKRTAPCAAFAASKNHEGRHWLLCHLYSTAKHLDLFVRTALVTLACGTCEAAVERLLQ